MTTNEWHVKVFRHADDDKPDFDTPHLNEAEAVAQFNALKEAIEIEGGKVELWPPNSRKWKFLFSMQPPSPKEP